MSLADFPFEPHAHGTGDPLIRAGASSDVGRGYKAALIKQIVVSGHRKPILLQPAQASVHPV